MLVIGKAPYSLAEGGEDFLPPLSLFIGVKNEYINYNYINLTNRRLFLYF